MQLPTLLLILLWAAKGALSGTTVRGFELVFSYWTYRMDYELHGAKHTLAVRCLTEGKAPCDFDDFVKHIERVSIESNYDADIGRICIEDPMNSALSEVVTLGYWDGGWPDEDRKKYTVKGNADMWWEKGEDWVK